MEKKSLLRDRGLGQRILSLRTSATAGVYDFPILKDDCLISPVQNYFLNVHFKAYQSKGGICVQTRELTYN